MATIARRVRRRVLRHPVRLLLHLATGLLVVQLLSSVPEPRPAAPAIDLVNGTVDITAAPVTGAVTLADMLPGDSVTGSVVVGNGGSGPFLYGLSSATTDAILGAQLDLAVWDEAGENDPDGACAPVAPAVLLYGPSDLGGPSPLSVVAGRALPAGSAETLCFDISLPLTTGNEFQGASTVATFEFVSEGDAPEPLGSDTGASTTVPSETTLPTTTSVPSEEPPAPTTEPSATEATPDSGAPDPAPATDGVSTSPRGTGEGGVGDDPTAGQEASPEPGVDPAPLPDVTTTSAPEGERNDPVGASAGSDDEAAPPQAGGMWNEILERLEPVLRAVREVAEAARFPMVLLIAMVLFLLLQDAIDRRDPKLALAPVFPEPDVEFPAAPTGDLKATSSEPRNPR